MLKGILNEFRSSIPGVPPFLPFNIPSVRLFLLFSIPYSPPTPPARAPRTT